MYKLPVHVFLSFALWIVAMVLFYYARTDAVMAAIDGVTLYVYSKPIFDPVSAQNAPAVSTNFLNTDPNKCKDMSAWMFPTVGYYSTNPGCTILFTTGWALLNGGPAIDGWKVNITSMDTSHAVNCTNGVYILKAVGGTQGSSFQVSNPTLTISGVAPNQYIRLNNFSLGGAWAILGAAQSNYDVCVKERAALASQINGNLSCMYENSQMCTCVYEFTNRMTNLSSVFPVLDPKTADNTLPQMVQKGANTCQTRRRAVDIRTRWDQGIQPLSHLVLMFTFAMFMNCVYHLALKLEFMFTNGPINVYMQFSLYAAFVAIVVLLGHTIIFVGYGGGSYMFLCVWLPAALHGLYWEFAVFIADDHHMKYRGFLHPMAYGICMGCLMIFSMISRGVTQQEHLLTEAISVAANTALYSAATWYFAYSREERANQDSGLSTLYVHESYIMVSGIAMLGATNHMIIPYPIQQYFLLQILFPSAFALISLAIISWPSTFNLGSRIVYASRSNQNRTAASVQPDTEPTAGQYFNDQGGILLFLVGVAFLGVALDRHMQVWISLHSSNSFSTLVNYPAGVGSFSIPGWIKHAPF